MSTNVNHPAHYDNPASGIEHECIEYIWDTSGLQFNAMKYVYRAGLKGDTREDMMKAVWYIMESIIREKPFQVIDEDLLETIDPNRTVRSRIFYYLAIGERNAAMSLIGQVLACPGRIHDDPNRTEKGA